MDVIKGSNVLQVTSPVVVESKSKETIKVTSKLPLNKLGFSRIGDDLVVDEGAGAKLTIAEFWRNCATVDTSCSVMVQSELPSGDIQQIIFVPTARLLSTVYDGAVGNLAANSVLSTAYTPTPSSDIAWQGIESPRVTTDVKAKASHTASASNNSHLLWYAIGGVAVAGGAAVVALSGSGKDKNNASNNASNSAPSESAIPLAENVSQAIQVPTISALQSKGGTWRLSGADAEFFTINAATGAVSVNSATGFNFELPADLNKDNVYTLNAQLQLPTGVVENIAFAVRVTDLVEVPVAITSSTYVKAAEASGLTDLNSAIASLLSNDGSQDSWNALNALKNRPVSTAVSLSYAFQDVNSQFTADNGDLVAIDGQFNNTAKDFIRSVFAQVASFANVNFIENQTQDLLGADIRLFSGSSDVLQVDNNVLGYAYQPEGVKPKAIDYVGDFFFVNDSAGVPAAPFTTAYGDERNTIAHELGHALGLDHPFGYDYSDEPLGGFYPYESEQISLNNFWDFTGGGHDTPSTDFMLETIMTYHNANLTYDRYISSDFTVQTPYTFGVYDIAALQHLYGANTNVKTGDDVYRYDSNKPVFDTIWDGGGNDSIVHTGDNNAIIDLRGGEHFSKVGALSGAHLSIDLASLGLPTSAKLTVEGGEALYKIVNGQMEVDLLTPDSSTTIALTLSDARQALTAKYEYTIDPAFNYNLGIAFGVTIENATGGSGNDQIWGNDAPNQLTGNAGDDVFYASLGADVYNSGTGIDTLVAFSLAELDSDVWSDFSSTDTIDLSALSLSPLNISWDSQQHSLTLSKGGTLAHLQINTVDGYRFNLLDLIL